LYFVRCIHTVTRFQRRLSFFVRRFSGSPDRKFSTVGSLLNENGLLVPPVNVP